MYKRKNSFQIYKILIIPMVELTPTTAFTSSIDTLSSTEIVCRIFSTERFKIKHVHPMNALLWRIYIFIIRSYDIFMVCAHFPLFMENLCYHLKTVWIWIWDRNWDWDLKLWNRTIGARAVICINFHLFNAICVGRDFHYLFRHSNE